MLEITICATILKNLNMNTMLASDDENQLMLRLKQHCIVLSNDLNTQYMEYCKKNKINMDLIQTFLAYCSHDKKNCRILSGSELKNKFSRETDAYLKALMNTCAASEDKILISDSSRLNKTELENHGLELIRKAETGIGKSLNTFTKYTFPIVLYEIKEGEDSKKLGKWLGRILSGESSFAIYDNYFGDADNLKNFRKYILKYIPKGADITIITTETQDLKKEEIKEELKKDGYKDWGIEVYLAKSKKDSHPRVIATPGYNIVLDRGLSTFGRGGKTFSSMLTIEKNAAGDWYRRKVGAKIFP